MGYDTPKFNFLGENPIRLDDDRPIEELLEIMKKKYEEEQRKEKEKNKEKPSEE